MFDSIFSDGSLRDYIQKNIHDPWKNTPFEGYVYMSPKQKGEFGERFVSKYFELLGHEVKRAKSSTAGHDRIIDDILTEIKFSIAIRDSQRNIQKDKFIINHVSKNKDWERLIFFGINEKEEDCRFFWFTKNDFLNHLKNECCLFKHQQAGKSVANDDYICTNIDKLIREPFIHTINQWNCF
jgi:hypothetical protein